MKWQELNRWDLFKSSVGPRAWLQGIYLPPGLILALFSTLSLPFYLFVSSPFYSAIQPKCISHPLNWFFSGIYHSEKASKYADLIITDENQALSLKNRLLMGIFRKKNILPYYVFFLLFKTIFSLALLFTLIHFLCIGNSHGFIGIPVTFFETFQLLST